MMPGRNRPKIQSAEHVSTRLRLNERFRPFGTVIGIVGKHHVIKYLARRASCLPDRSLRILAPPILQSLDDRKEAGASRISSVVGF